MALMAGCGLRDARSRGHACRLQPTGGRHGADRKPVVTTASIGTAAGSDEGAPCLERALGDLQASEPQAAPHRNRLVTVVQHKLNGVARLKLRPIQFELHAGVFALVPRLAHVEFR